jgi:hypothetical protein
MMSASNGRVHTMALVSGMTWLTKCSAVLRTWGVAMLISPSAVRIALGRMPLRGPFASAVRS